MGLSFTSVLLALFVLFVALIEVSRRSTFRSPVLSWHGTRVLVTGASAGIGRELALQLCAKKAHVLLVARREVQLQAVKLQCEKIGGKADILVADASDKNAVARIRGAVESVFGGTLDVLLLNHGLGATKPFDELSDADIDTFEHILQVNYVSYLRLVHGLWRITKQSIVAVGSLAGCYGPPLRSGYAPTKWALRGLWETLRHDLGHTNIKFTIIQPGYVLTEVHDKQAVGAVERQNLDQWMSTEQAARLSLEGIARGDREVRLDNFSHYLQVFDGLVRYSGNLLDWLVARKAHALLKYTGKA